MTDPGTRVEQATQPGSALPDAARTTGVAVADLEGQRPIAFKPLAGAAGLHLVLLVMSLMMILPFTWMVLTSLKPVDQVNNENWIPEKAALIDSTTKQPTLDESGNPVMVRWQWWNYLNVFDTENPDPHNRGVDFGRFYWNSLFIATWVTFLQVTTSAMAAFSFSRLQWPGRDKVFVLYLSTMMLPGLVMMIPNYQIMITLGLVDTFIGLIIPAAFSAFGTFLLRQFMLTIPASLDEAAEIDGANKWRLFWDIILPLARPGLITLTIFTFMGNYNSFFWPLVMIKSQAKYTLPIGLMYFDSARGQSTHLLMAAVTMSVIPMILLFVFLQKYLVKGIQLGAVKG